MIPNVLYSIEEVFIEIVLFQSSKLDVEIYVQFQPCTLVKLNRDGPSRGLIHVQELGLAPLCG